MKDDNIFERVTDQMEDSEYAEKKRKAKMGITTSALAVIILLGAYAYSSHVNKLINSETVSNGNVDNTDLTVGIVETEEDNNIVEETTNDENIIEDNNSSEIIEDVVTDSTSNSDYYFNYKDIDYSNVDSFINEITEYRNKYGSFAESFQTREDVINFVNFFYLFDETRNAESSISSQAQFDEILSDYYKSCVIHDIKPNIGSLFSSDSIIGKKFSESETLVFNLKNGKGTDYTISNQYYMWLEDNLVNKETAIPEIMKYSPLIDALREMYQQYREVGNMNAARRNQKNDYYKVEQRDVYYDHNYGEGVEVTMENHSFSCPDGIDNYVSKTENVEEKKWIISDDGSVPFGTVNYYFEYVLNNRKVR